MDAVVLARTRAYMALFYDGGKAELDCASKHQKRNKPTEVKRQIMERALVPASAVRSCPHPFGFQVRWS